MATSDPIALLARTFEQTGTIIAGIRPDQATLPTPCPDWDVRALINYTVHDLHIFSTMLSGEERPAPGADLIGTNWTESYRAASDALLSSWRQRGTGGTCSSGRANLRPPGRRANIWPT